MTRPRTTCWWCFYSHVISLFKPSFKFSAIEASTEWKQLNKNNYECNNMNFLTLKIYRCKLITHYKKSPPHPAPPPPPPRLVKDYVKSLLTYYSIFLPSLVLVRDLSRFSEFSTLTDWTTWRTCGETLTLRLLEGRHFCAAVACFAHSWSLIKMRDYSFHNFSRITFYFKIKISI